jgi:Dynein heavy chain C-terminal domain
MFCERERGLFIVSTLAILLDGAAKMNEHPIDMHIESVMMSGNQTEPPEMGLYVTGLHLLGASYDFHKNHLIDAANNKLYTSIPCVNWILVVDSSVNEF